MEPMSMKNLKIVFTATLLSACGLIPSTRNNVSTVAGAAYSEAIRVNLAHPTSPNSNNSSNSDNYDLLVAASSSAETLAMCVKPNDPTKCNQDICEAGRCYVPLDPLPSSNGKKFFRTPPGSWLNLWD